MYDSFYNLKCNPFQLNSDPDFFYQSTMYKSAIMYMRYGLMRGEGFVVITGGGGLGKTMLVKELVNTLDDEEVIIEVMVSPQLSAEDTLRAISGIFDLPTVDLDKVSLRSNIEEFIKTTSDNGQRILLIVDEAQNLSKQSLEELRMLSNFERNGKIIFQTFLVGQNELRETIFAHDMDQFKQRIVSAFQLKPLNVIQTQEYIIFRLKKAGWDHRPDFDDEVFQRIYEFTSGFPRKINTLCDRILFHGFLAERLVINIEFVKKVISDLEEEMSVGIEPANKEVSELEEKVSVDVESENTVVAKLKEDMSEGDESSNKEVFELEEKVRVNVEPVNKVVSKREGKTEAEGMGNADAFPDSSDNEVSGSKEDRLINLERQLADLQDSHK